MEQPPRDSDAALVARIADGDERAFATLVSVHHGALFAVARRMLRDDAEAEDIVQEVFLKVWRRPEAWRPDGAALSTWLYRVASNACIDRLRRRVPTPVDRLPDSVDPNPGPGHRLEARQTADRVERALAALPERQRLAIVLTYYQGLANREAAEALDVSVDALESLLARARRKLKDELVEEWRSLLDTDDMQDGLTS